MEEEEEESSPSSTGSSSRSSQKRGRLASAQDVAAAGSGAVRICFTGIDPVPKELRALKKMGAVIEKDVMNATHIVSSVKIKRTIKFLSAMSVVSHVVHPEWIEKSIKSGTLLDPTEFALHDKEGEKKWSFSLAKALAQPCRRVQSGASGVPRGDGAMHGLEVYATAGVRPPPAEMRKIIEAAGGT